VKRKKEVADGSGREGKVRGQWELKIEDLHAEVWIDRKAPLIFRAK
jgi:putative aminopeptidase FrvX